MREGCGLCARLGRACHHHRGPEFDPFDELDGRCNARRKDGTGLCRRPAGAGTPHRGVGRCKLHGGSTPAHVAKAEVEIASQRAAAAVKRFGLGRPVAPEIALLQELARTQAHLDWLERWLADNENAADLDPKDQRRIKFNAHRRLWTEERTHLVHVARVTLDAGVAERRVRLAEEQGHQVAAALRGILADLGVADHPDAPRVVRKHLTALIDTETEDSRPWA